MRQVEIMFYPDRAKPVSIQCEVADDFFSKTKGLMHRSSLPKNSGMFFPFLFSSYRVFWMKNVKTSLDIIYIGKNYRIKKIVETSADAKMYQKAFWTFGFGKYIVECNKGFCKKHNIFVGTKLSIEKIK